ncbi:15-hydroxyprostaglandin dehydrogenase-like protein [Cladobotryum mycophilum]|uniref:15-hydroxyprostaglandin dehydrogenase-like protein n=1 Tax=Cladobotryum mycophilum TaxID=491253 RepID=A0ABR0SJD3_9HYPO
MAAPFSVSGKTAIVTGAGSGINLAFAQLLLSRGCNVVFADIALRPEAKDVVSQYQGKDGGPRAVWVETDVASWPALTKMFEVTLAEFGDFDILCPGAGVYEPQWSNFWHPPGTEASKDDIDGGRYALLDINITHPIRSTQMALSYWLHPRPISGNSKFTVPAKVSLTNPKRVIHISSIAAQLPTFLTPLYGASKHAISGFVRCLAPLEADIGVRVNAVAPGVVQTPLWTEQPGKMQILDLTKDVWVTPKEVAEAMLSCVESEAYVGGTVLEIGTGQTRQVRIFNDPGPDRKPEHGLGVSNMNVGKEQIGDWLLDEKIWGASQK